MKPASFISAAGDIALILLIAFGMLAVFFEVIR